VQIHNPSQDTVTPAIGHPFTASTEVFLVGPLKLTVVPPALAEQKLRFISLFNQSSSRPAYLFFDSNSECACEIAPKGLFTIGFLGSIALSSEKQALNVSVTVFDALE